MLHCVLETWHGPVQAGIAHIASVQRSFQLQRSLTGTSMQANTPGMLEAEHKAEKEGAVSQYRAIRSK